MSEQRSKADNISWQGFSTKAVHAGYEPDPLTGAVNVPIYASSTFAQDGVGGMRSGFEYARTGNPTRRPLEANLAALESGTYGRAFSSGMAATDCLLRSVLRPGDHLVIPDDAYGGTFRLIDKVFTQWGIEYTPAPVSDVDAVRAAMKSNTKLVWVETPTNPLLNIGDIELLAEVAHEGNAKIVVDNTFASPYLQQPLQLGADIALHSTTKYIGGTLRRGRWRSRLQRRRTGHRVCLPAERIRRRSRPVRRVPDVARNQDTGAAHGASQ